MFGVHNYSKANDICVASFNLWNSILWSLNISQKYTLTLTLRLDWWQLSNLLFSQLRRRCHTWLPYIWWTLGSSLGSITISYSSQISCLLSRFFYLNFSSLLHNTIKGINKSSLVMFKSQINYIRIKTRLFKISTSSKK